MKIVGRLLISLAGGGVLAWLTGLYCQIPSNGPRLGTLPLVVLMQLSKAISHDDQNVGEVVFWGLLVMFYAVVIFGMWWVIAGLMNERRGSKK